MLSTVLVVIAGIDVVYCLMGLFIATFSRKVAQNMIKSGDPKRATFFIESATTLDVIPRLDYNYVGLSISGIFTAACWVLYKYFGDYRLIFALLFKYLNHYLAYKIIQRLLNKNKVIFKDYFNEQGAVVVKN